MKWVWSSNITTGLTCSIDLFYAQVVGPGLCHVIYPSCICQGLGTCLLTSHVIGTSPCCVRGYDRISYPCLYRSHSDPAGQDCDFSRVPAIPILLSFSCHVISTCSCFWRAFGSKGNIFHEISVFIYLSMTLNLFLHFAVGRLQWLTSLV